MEFKNIFKELRKEKGLSQAETAKIFNVDQTTISTWEIGRSEPDFQSAKIIADYFNVDVNYLLGVAPIDTNPITTRRKELNKLLDDVNYDNMKPEQQTKFNEYAELLLKGLKNKNQ